VPIQRQDIDATIDLLAERFPRAFFRYERKRVPLKIGVTEDILAALGDAIDRKLLGLAIRFYCNNFCYRAAQLEGAPRIDLEGAPCGAVSEADALSAARSVILAKAARRKRRAGKPEAVPETAPPPPPPSPPQPPKRLGLSDLRAAALARKAADADDQTRDDAAAATARPTSAGQSHG
jgi:ProP effector